MGEEPAGKAPWHLWAIGVAALLWYAAGTVTIFMAQLGMLAVTPGEAAYYAAQAPWFRAVTDVADFAGIAGAAMLLMRSAKALRVFVLSLVAIAVTHGYDYAMGTSRSYDNNGALAVNVIVVVIAVLLIGYSAAMKRRGVLR
ncbi:MAG: hypothetical protein P0Y56_05560 [Candidatus Andeanibacterium colombiense]|uniref:Uncharacterized protein n=1 Tax=Candidatus Andeanibacterium colombiense TaxID=3121345 RepID=A0AAJ5X8L6_9SPHN|nr:MAG: hypothetical protein P0Y56_05560 [Sphingomonadaceae bacterium]